jgi:glycosyltransferase involved in cell wall biosynthesis
MNKILAISIPTFNRAQYLKELLQSIKSQTDLHPSILESLQIYIFDNNSTDNTQEIIKQSSLIINYIKNETNIEANPNIHQAYTIPKEEYIWVIGDDELLPENSISEILFLIDIYNPSLIINNSGYNSLTNYRRFNSYFDFTIFAQNRNPHMLIAHSLISSNIIKRDCFDSKFALLQLKNEYTYQYANFYGMISGLKNNYGKVIIPVIPTITVREQRAISLNSEIFYASQIKYLKWISEKYILSINPNNIVFNYECKLFYNTFKNNPKQSIIRFIFSIHTEMYNRYKILRPILKEMKILYYKYKGNK